jgi:hypothetical protein
VAGVDRPDAAQVREWATNNDDESSFDFDRYGLTAPETPGDPDRLDRAVAIAVGYVEWATGRKLDGSLTDPGLVAIAQDAVLMRTEQQLVGRGTTRAVRDALEASEVKTLRAGDYSVTRRDPVDSNKGLLINPWRALSDALRALCTPDRWAEWLAELGGKPRPLGITVSPPGSVDPYGYPELA